MELCVIADDFTGALDTGVQFAKAGIATFVTASLAFDAVPQGTRVLVIDSQTRHCTPECAAKTVKALILDASLRGVRHIYKKTDSTLRGNVGAELCAAMETLKGEPVMFVPAYPLAGRTTLGGRQYVDGVPLSMTTFARDPQNPVRSSNIDGILRETGNMDLDFDVKTIGVGTDDPLGNRQTVYVFDASTQDELEAAGDLIRRRGRLRLTAGCAGFAAVLAGLLEFQRSGTELPVLPERVIAINGSVHGLSQRQFGHAGPLGYHMAFLDGRQLLDLSYADTDEGKSFIDSAARALEHTGRLALSSVGPDEQRMPATQGQTIAAGLGRLVSGIVEAALPCTLVVFGGDTAYGVMQALGCTGLEPKGEIEAGVPLCVMHCRAGRLPLITKAGGLGSPDVLINIENAIRRKMV
jgi:uncharacterized protein YgbK (DUF1537 family)